jgi:hypothetical protein
MADGAAGVAGPGSYPGNPGVTRARTRRSPRGAASGSGRGLPRRLRNEPNSSEHLVHQVDMMRRRTWLTGPPVTVCVRLRIPP